jgi:rare lipoprotein A
VVRPLACVLLLLAGCAHAVREEQAEAEEGDASYYGPGLYGQRTASGEVLRPGTLTAAHRTLPFGTCVRVTVLNTGRSLEVRINDRGPFVAGRILDVSEAAARALGILGKGLARVRLTPCGSASAGHRLETLASLAAQGAWVEEDGCSSPSTPRR